MLKDFKFGSEAITYIRSCLSEGDTLSKYLLDSALGRGQVKAHLPADADPGYIKRFRWGGVTTRNNTRQFLTTFISAHLIKKGKQYAVFETLYRPGDICLLSSKEHFFTHKLEVYYFLNSHDIDSDIIVSTVRFARSYPFIGVLTSIPEEESDIQAEHELPIDKLKKFVARTEYILIGAYDNEGVLIWSKN